MTLTKAGAIAYKVFCVAIMLFLLLGAIGMFMHYRYTKGMIGLLAIVIMFLKFKQEASVRNLLIVTVTLLVAMFGVGLVN
jgi:hypothetical protein